MEGEQLTPVEKRRLILAEKLLSYIFHPDFQHHNPPAGYSETLAEWLNLRTKT